MKTQTSLVASQVRLQDWAIQIQECQNRPSGMDVQTWCDQHGLTRANYYYRLRKVREACLEMTGQEILPNFVELEPPASVPEPISDSVTSPACIVLASGARIELRESASPAFIEKLLGVLCHAQ